MRKIISLIMSICIVITGLPIMAYAQNCTPEISLEEFSEQLQEMQTEYDDTAIFSAITIKNETEFYHIDGEEYILEDNGKPIKAEITDNDFEIPFSAIEPYCELPKTSTYSLDNENYDDVTVDKETAKALGFEVDIEDDKAVLTQPYQTERLIVKSKYDINPLDSVAIVEGYNDLHIVQFDNQESAKQAEEYYNKQKLIEYAEPDLIMSTMDIDYDAGESAVTSSSISFGEHLSWGSDTIGVDDYIDYLGDIDALPEIVVGIIDTGIDLDHEFLKDRIIETNYNTSGSGTENSEDDDKGHGTHVAGIIVDNTTENVKIKGYKVMDNNGQGSTLNICLAIDSAVADNVNVINMSLGGPGKSSWMEESVNNAVKKGITVCVSAGNSGRDAANYTPANIDSAITVAAIDAYDQKPYWSNWGNKVNIVAPGVSIYSTYKDNTYETLNGTSMACPFVTAASALLLTKNIDDNCDTICGILEDNGRIWYSESDSQYQDGLYGKRALYIGTVTDFNNDRAPIPKFSVESGRYTDSFYLEISCDDENAEIYYTTDGSRANSNTGKLYTEPIKIDEITIISAVAYLPNKLKSLQVTAQYYLTYFDLESNFVINSDGLITKYKGNNDYLAVPDTINGITVTGIGSSVFIRSSIAMIKLPDTVTSVGTRAFSDCNNLTSFECKNLKTTGLYSFYNCRKLKDIDLTNLEKIDKYSFYGCQSIPALYNDKLTEIPESAFGMLLSAINVDLPNVTSVNSHGLYSLRGAEFVNFPKLESIGYGGLQSCAAKFLSLPNLVTLSGKWCFRECLTLKSLYLPKLEGNIPNETFYYCQRLESLYIPNVSSIGEEVFHGCTRLNTIFAPNLTVMQSPPENNDVNIYLSDFCTELIDTKKNLQPFPDTKYNYTIIAPSGSYAEQYAKENGHTFIPSDSRDENIENPANVTDLGRSICCSAAGVRFGFTWDNIDKIENLANDIEYGFIYSQKGAENLSIDTVDDKNIKKAVANNRVNHGDTTSFNLVIANIPTSYYDREITARAYVCIDGMYFYSNVRSGSFSEVSNLVLADDGIDEGSKNAVKNLLSKEM